METSTSQRFRTTMKAMTIDIFKGVISFKKTFLTYIVVLTISGLIYAASSIYPNINTLLEDSRSTPWGIVTSIFVHSGLDHISSNMIYLFIFMLLFAFCNSSMHSDSKRMIESFFIMSSFGAAIAVNFLWILLTSNYAVGASGLVYATEGSLLAFSLVNGLQTLFSHNSKVQKPLIKVVGIMNLSVSIFILVQVFNNPIAFLNVRQGVNVFAHGVSFLICLFVSLLWINSSKVSILEQSGKD